ncbi:putative E2F transcription factor [Ordospora colligata]|uniref:Putative E2F transcription factor n=1 Tax=Ordospora colligata OC4 TaxID=1354746 RepID=A0A0B2UJU8_9MICR|nr:putative E2F transcription factor [Ordospora colligata OC4]KHN69529.1 putative E2F transcription factor [Ordospora colligata OC4]TBU15349.1 putative E2F transcription factor [Ordospora colligata]TBU15449.1 putative E2F transcription factor [Ordospora colligata]TBU18545.1 putative E2F transcription factor [Ordospora colligata]
MKCPNSEMDGSENRREGLKYITQAVFQLLKENKACTYQFICKNIVFPNTETLNRRIYDVLNVMKAVGLIDKKGKKYFLVGTEDDTTKKLEEIKKLKEMKKVFKFIVDRNSSSEDTHLERLYLPFMVISTSKKAEIHCETNEERSFFVFKSSKPLKVNEDLDVLSEIYENKHSIEKISDFASIIAKMDNERYRCFDEKLDHKGELDPSTFFFGL